MRFPGGVRRRGHFFISVDFFLVGCAWVSVAGWGFSSCGEWGPQLENNSSCGIFQGQGWKHVCPALAGGFSSTGPPGKPKIAL